MFGRKSSEGRKSPGRFMSGINDEVHGAHFDGDDIVLSKVLGGGRFPSRPLGDSMPETASGEFRLVLHDFRVTTDSGDSAVSVDTVPRQLAVRILSSFGLSGMLSVYTPEDSDAAEAVREASTFDPLLYETTTGICSREYLNYRTTVALATGDDLPGPVCMFGPEIVDADDHARCMRYLRAYFGYEPWGHKGIRLSPDLGSLELTIPDFEEGTVLDDGQIHAVLMSEVVGDAVSELGGRGIEVSEDLPSGVSVEPVPRNIALRICRNTMRSGGLCIHVQTSAEAWDIAKAVFAKGKPYEAPVPSSLAGMVAGVVGIRGKDRVRIFYGSR